MRATPMILLVVLALSCGDISVPSPYPEQVDTAGHDASDPGQPDPGFVDPGGPDVPGIKCKAHGDCVGKVPGMGPCEESVCDPGTGTCVVRDRPQGANCDDLEPCTSDDWCNEQGQCVGRPVVCADDNPCTTDFCNAVGDCEFPFNHGPCDDGDACSVGDQCQEGKCVSDSGLPCDDDNDCTENHCLPEFGCVYEYIQGCISCNGDDDCETENQCTEGKCDNSKCYWAILNEKNCNDGNPCTVGDTCKQLVCLGHAEKDCNDDNPCTDDFCTVEKGCVHEPNQAGCEDGDPCTHGDFCEMGSCQTGAPLNCNDGNECTDDFCTPDSACPAGTISNPDATTDVACCHVELNCDDGKSCTKDRCDKTFGCTHESLCEEPNNPLCTKQGCRCGLTTVCTDTADNCKVGFLGDLDGTCLCGNENACENGAVCCNGKCCAAGLMCCNNGTCSNSCQP